MNPIALIFFGAFILVVVGGYLAIRRQVQASGIIATGTVIGGVVTMLLFSLAQGNVLAHAVLVGVLMGGGVSAAALTTAWYFLGNELKTGQHSQASKN